MIIIREYCNFIKGYYYEDKYFCFQVKKKKRLCLYFCLFLYVIVYCVLDVLKYFFKNIIDVYYILQVNCLG